MLQKGNGERVVIDDNRTSNSADERFFAYWQKDEFVGFLTRSGYKLVDFLERKVSERTTWLSFFVRIGKMPVVHGLLYGSPLCGFSREMPINWSEGHFFTRIEDIENISCSFCNSIATLDEGYRQFSRHSRL